MKLTVKEEKALAFIKEFAKENKGKMPTDKSIAVEVGYTDKMVNDFGYQYGQRLRKALIDKNRIKFIKGVDKVKIL